MTTDDLEALVQELYDRGCPVSYDNSCSKTRSGCACCYWCEALLDYVIEEHADDCPWLKVEKLCS